MNYRIIPVTAFSQNCSLIWCEQTRLAALVDPGGDAEKIKQEVDASGLTLMQRPADAWSSGPRWCSGGTGATLRRAGFWPGKRR